MKIVVLSGSPKTDELSVTMQYVRYIQKRFPSHKYTVIPVARNIKNIENSNELLKEIVAEIGSSDLILWAFPVYIFLVPSQYKRFIEVIFERGLMNAFKDKRAASISTSIHFYDNIAQDYIHSICDDLSMKYIGYFTADMYDLLKPRERERLRVFAESTFDAVINKIPTTRYYNQISHMDFGYKKGAIGTRVDCGDKKIIVLMDGYHENGSNVTSMVDRFKNSIVGQVEIVDIRDLNMQDGCSGCLRCTLDNRCMYEKADDFSVFYNTRLRQADIIVVAGYIKDRYLSARWKQFIDRTFFYNHVPSLRQKQFGFIISGALSQVPAIRQIFEAHIALHQSNLVDFVTDESCDCTDIDLAIDNLARRLLWFAGKEYRKSSSFLNVAGMKIFRDEVWGRLRMILQADHRYYKLHGLYDYPHRDIGNRIVNLAMEAVTCIPAFKNRFKNVVVNEMVKPLKKVINIRAL